MIHADQDLIDPAPSYVIEYLSGFSVCQLPFHKPDIAPETISRFSLFLLPLFCRYSEIKSPIPAHAESHDIAYILPAGNMGMASVFHTDLTAFILILQRKGNAYAACRFRLTVKLLDGTRINFGTFRLGHRHRHTSKRPEKTRRLMN